jgi:predicted AAA+ superfamily ATPase
MAITNQERVGKALELLKEGLRPFVEREMKAQHAQMWFEQARSSVGETLGLFGNESQPRWEIATLLAVMWNQWNLVFRKTLGQAERTLVSELRDVRNKWAHQNPFSGDDTYRALDSASRLLTAISASQADEIGKVKDELLRVRFDEQVRNEKRKTSGTAVESQVTGTLKPWREVVTPHHDVAKGRYLQAEFAADLWQVYLGDGSDEYRKPSEFFRRTFLTESLKHLLVSAVRRLSQQGGDPVVQLQTNFGGGKTHSMLALYHLCSGTPAAELLGVDALLAEAGVKALPKVNRVVLVGNKISPGNPVTKPDGTVVRTFWGELAWQLGKAAGGDKEGKKAYSRIQADDEKATSPGDVLRDLMNQYGPCLILIDEWVAYARQLHEKRDLPGGDFETHFTFAQTLTEAAKAAKQCLLVISLPASDTAGSPHALAADVEVGGERGRAALDRLRNAVGRVEASWRPATAEEGFEIVRRRLFEPLAGNKFVARDTVATAFHDLYRAEKAEFPLECSESDYERRLKAAYPIHPEVFDRLYTEWSTLVKFQRTRGVLRLMAAVIHSLWEKQDRNPLILPSMIPIGDPFVQSELTRYLSDNWAPVIEKDVDGPNSLPLRLDGEAQNLGRYAATRRVARTIYIGSAPTVTAAHHGIDDKRIKLGCVMPGESPNVFGDALRRLASSATFLYEDGGRYWYSTQENVTQTAEGRAEDLRRNPEKVAIEIEKRIRYDVRNTGDFRKVHPLPQSSQDVSDDPEARLVVLSIDKPYSKDPNAPAMAEAKAILDFRSNSPRLLRNSLAFLAIDQARLQDLDEAVRRYLAWDSIVDDRESLELKPSQVKSAEAQLKSADATVNQRLPEAYQWLIVPVQTSPQGQIDWQAFRLQGSDPLAVRASKKLHRDDLLLTGLAGTGLKMELDRIPLWRGDHVAVKQLVEDFGRYIYLPRLADTQVLLSAIADGLNLLTWEQEGFAFADSYDEGAARYRGLKYATKMFLTDTNSGLLVKPEAARRQINAELAAAQAAGAGGGTTAAGTHSPGATPAGSTSSGHLPFSPTPKLNRFHGTAELDAARLGKEAGRIAEEVVSHLAGLIGANVKVTLEIEAEIPNGAPDNVVRTVTENARTLKFKNQGFESD